LLFRIVAFLEQLWTIIITSSERVQNVRSANRQGWSVWLGWHADGHINGEASYASACLNPVSRGGHRIPRWATALEVLILLWGFGDFGPGVRSMIDWKAIADLIGDSDVTNPEFVELVLRQFPGKRVVPDDEDFDLSADVSTKSRARKEYRKAQVRKIVRMYREWKITRGSTGPSDGGP
jgi:hypothetical protein